MSTPGGNVLQAPPGWSRKVSGRMLRFDAPEGDLRLAVVDVGKAPNARAAAAAAWSLFQPGQAPKLLHVTTEPGRRGWDERDDLAYDVSAGEHLELYATAYRRGGAWTVVIVRGSQATSEKRYGGIALASASLHPAGYVAETFAGRVARPLDATRVAAMRSFVETSIRKLRIPGAAFALIDHGKVVYEGGVGVKAAGNAAPVDAHTLFMVASNTKGMTTLLLAELVDQGLLTWDEPVTKAYPSFRLGDAQTTARVRIRDLICACTGLPRTDMEWLFNTPPTTPAGATFSQLAATQPTSGFGEIFQYNNQMASAAGYIAGHLLYPNMEVGAAYDRAMRERVFSPLQMNDTTFSFTHALHVDHALPSEVDIDGRTKPISLAFDDVIVPFRPAGGAWSSAHDMIKYVGLELTKGVLPDGRRLVSEKNLLVRRMRGVPTGYKQWYGMGLWEDASKGVSVIYHGGNMPGFQSDFAVIPSADVGAVILTNSGHGNLLVRPFKRRLLELLYDGKPEAAEDVATASRKLDVEIAQDRAKLTLPGDPAVLGGLAREYANPDLGPLRVRIDRAGARITTNSLTSLVATRKDDDGTISLVPIDPGAPGVQLIVGSKEGSSTLTLRDGQHIYVFKEARSRE